MNRFTYFIPLSAVALAWACATTSPPLVTGPGVSPSASTQNAEGIEYYQLGHWSVAKGHFEAAIEAEPDLAEPHYNLALALHKLGSHTEATEHVMLAAQLAPSYRAITESSLYQHHVDWPQASGDGYLSCCGFTSERVPGY